MVRLPLVWNQILNNTVECTFGMVRHDKKTGELKFHKGWDLAAPRGTAVYPVSLGEVVGVSTVNEGQYGKTINLKFEHQGKTYYAFYAHLDAVYVSKGQKIEKTNAAIGAVGTTGNAGGSKEKNIHLHFEFRNRKNGGFGTEDRIDPAFFFGPPPMAGIWFIDDE